MRILLDPNIDTEKIAKQRPLETNFVVDIRSLKHREDIKKYMYCKWIHRGSHTDIFKCMFGDKSDLHVEKPAEGASGDNVFYLKRLHSTHPSNIFGELLLFFQVRVCVIVTTVLSPVGIGSSQEQGVYNSQHIPLYILVMTSQPVVVV